MVDVFKYKPFGTYPAVTAVVSAAAKAEINTAIAVLEGIFAKQTATVEKDMASPYFNTFTAQQCDAVKAELAGLKAAIAAAPVA